MINKVIFAIAERIRDLRTSNKEQAVPERSMAKLGLSYEDGYEQALIDVKAAMVAILEEHKQTGLPSVLDIIIGTNDHEN